MSSSSESGSLRGLGAKYGSTVRKRYARIMNNLKRTRRCPSCGSTRFRRKSAGIWACLTCNFTITGEAYTISMPKS
ncbi:MAG TPA: 50S ribosomal protein L37 [Nitrososphaerales archaeon]|nr:50S ribosomal protein L37 [Nitrososphaerales archaeon]